MIESALLVDPDDANWEQVRPELERFGIAHLHRARGAKEASDILSEPVDLVIFEIRLPDADPREFLKEARGADVITIIATTNTATRTEVGNILLAGAHGFLEKPFTVEDLAREMIQAEKSSVRYIKEWAEECLGRGMSIDQVRNEMTRMKLETALERTKGDRCRAAARLGLTDSQWRRLVGDLGWN